ncbi:hypothetical protein SD70_04615 [Gordoniibacillus kamchatkensis]|uniref:Uncharacterized protein n=1 Tax=Gordoniibacillus kamchatkensis TaxID=1590651 RepID=A0ABR5ALI6_9BACL|nr:hypothetical protein SD70_04615 [Paenibacillus sp. VKM B-2647]
MPASVLDFIIPNAACTKRTQGHIWAGTYNLLFDDPQGLIGFLQHSFPFQTDANHLIGVLIRNIPRKNMQLISSREISCML